MSLDKKIGELFIVSIPGKSINKKNRRIIEAIKPGGIIFFKHNFGSSRETWCFFYRLQNHFLNNYRVPVFLTTDQEFGRVRRIENNMTMFPSAMALGASKDPSLIQQASFITASELGAYGLNMNLAPVADVNNNPRNSVIRQRSFGASSMEVAKMVAAYTRGFNSGGLASVAKHFPGHGDTHIDTHIGLAIVKKSINQLSNTELPPFQRAIANKVDGIMTAHILFKNLDPHFPATLSRTVLSGLLRQKLKFSGIIITDDMDMGAIAKNFSGTKMKKIHPAVRSLKAGADLLIYTGPMENTQRAYLAVKDAIERGQLDKGQLDEKVGRIIDTKLKIYFGKKTLNWEESQKILKQREIIKGKSFSKGIAFLHGNRKFFTPGKQAPQKKEEFIIVSNRNEDLKIARAAKLKSLSLNQLTKRTLKNLQKGGIKKIILINHYNYIPGAWTRLYKFFSLNPLHNPKRMYFGVCMADNPFDISRLKNKSDLLFTLNGDTPRQVKSFIKGLSKTRQVGQ